MVCTTLNEYVIDFSVFLRNRSFSLLDSRWNPTKGAMSCFLNTVEKYHWIIKASSVASSIDRNESDEEVLKNCFNVFIFHRVDVQWTCIPLIVFCYISRAIKKLFNTAPEG